MTSPQAEHLAPVNVKTVPIVILLVDKQAIVGEAVKKLLEEDRDIQFHFCMDPSKAGLWTKFHVD